MSPDVPTVQLAGGSITGFRAGLVDRYTGIPYAQAERFQRPTTVEPWTTGPDNSFAATSACPACPQAHDPVAHLFLDAQAAYEALQYDEHCQYLSVTLPRLDTPKRLPWPVMVYFHGGAFVTGAADSPIYDPSRLVAENEVIVVNVGSRLGLFGYLGNPDCSSNADNDTNDTNAARRSCNLGLLDCLEALRWVQRHIAAFGGDSNPQRITIFGQSAGGSTVGDLLATAEAPTLFGRVIIQSAPLGITRGRGAMYRALWPVAAKITPTTPAQEVVAVAAEVTASARRYGLRGAMAIAPQYGCTPLPAEDELDAALAKRAQDTAVLIGSTAAEASMFVDLVPGLGTLSQAPLVGGWFSWAFTSYVSWRLYFGAQRAWYDVFARAGGDIAEYNIVWDRHNRRQQMGATHAIELPLLFSDEKTLKSGVLLKDCDWRAVDEDGRKLRRLWVDFAKGKRITVKDSLDGIIEVIRSSPRT